MFSKVQAMVRAAVVAVVLALFLPVTAQQVSNAGFEEWNGAKFNGEIQPTGWNASNVEQVGFKFNFAHRESGHSGSYSMMVQDQDVGAAGITETSPGYFSLGQPWVYLESVLKVNEATAGTYGGVSWKYRPDSMAVWIRRTGSHTADEDYYLLYYAWSGTARGEKYKAKNGGCTSVSKTDEESDVRLELNGNECGTVTKANQIAEGMIRERKTYNNWTRMVVPIYYFNNDVPTKMNIIFSASNYPNFRANNGLYAGNSLYVDDVEMIYSAKIQKLYVGGKEWKAFDPNSTEVQTYSLGETATTIPAITGRRGIGSLTNARGKTVTFNGRELNGTEMKVEYGDLESKPTKITVTSEDGKTTTVYQIQFQRAPSTNATLAEVQINGANYDAFRPGQTSYNVELPYGTTQAPVVTYTLAEDAQTAVVSQAASPTGTATITVTAADKTTKKTYTFRFSVGELKDATLADIKINGKSLPGFTPGQAIYKVSLPEGTERLEIAPVSAYPAGEQTITVMPNPLPSGADINGSTVQITVSAGKTSPVTKTYKLNIKLEKSSYAYLADLQVKGEQIEFVNPAKADDPTAIAFDPAATMYYVNLKMGTKSLPEVVYTPGDEYQTVTVESLPEGVVDGTVRVTVVAGNGADMTVYKLVYSTAKSEISTLAGIEIDGTPIAGFRPDSTVYPYALPIEATSLPVVRPIPHDEFQEIKTYAPAGLTGKYRISVTAGNGATTNYYIDFTKNEYKDNTLKSLSVAGYELQDADYSPVPFDPQRNEYWVKLSSDATEVPEVSLVRQSDLYQDTIVRYPTSTNGDYKVTVRPRNGTSRTYVIHFVCKKSANTALRMIYVAGDSLKGFAPEQLSYTHVLDTGTTEMPAVSWDLAESVQRVTTAWDNRTLRIVVQAQSGATRTYKIKFVIPSAAGTQLESLRLVTGGDTIPLPGFRKDSLDYTYQLAYGQLCPLIVAGSSAGQQVTVTAPYSAGVASIRVSAEDGSQTYTITFLSAPATTAQLEGILVNGSPIAEFAPETMTYTREYRDELPEVKGIPSASVDTVIVLWQDTVAWLHVKDAEGNKTAYSVVFTHPKSENRSLLAIYENRGEGETLLPGFDPAIHDYAYTLAPGSTYPTLRYEAAEEAQVLFSGQQAKGEWAVHVLAENGTEERYTVRYTVEQYSDATLQDLAVAGHDIAFVPETFDYRLTIDEGTPLPALTVTPREGQTVLQTDVCDTLQQVLVTAENGATNTYSVIYTRTLSSNALLADILIDGMSLPGFDPAVTEYTDSLPQGTKIIPNIFPVGQNANQTITTAFCRPDGTALIRVEAQSGATQDYTIAFPVKRSANTALGDLYLDSEDAEIKFKPATTDYEVILPYEATECPKMVYEKAEPEQRIDVVSRPIGQTSQIIVTAENGDARTYNIIFKRAVLKTRNLLSMIRIVELEQELSLKNKDQRDFNIEMPFGSRSLTVEYEKSYPEQTVFIQPGGVKAPTIITVKANNDSVADEVYRIIPSVPTADPAVLTDIRVNNTTITGFNPEQFSYIVKVTDKPILRYTLNKGAEINILEQTSKHWKAEVSYGTRTNTYEVWYYYQNDVIPNMDFQNWTNARTTTSARKPTGWNVLADFAEPYTYLVAFTFTPGDEVQQDGSNSVAYLHTQYNDAPLAGYVPGYMTLGNIEYHYQRWGSSSFSISGGITFRNTPDEMSYRIKVDKVNNNARVLYTLNGSGGETTLLQEEAKTSGYVTRTMDLSEANNIADEPTQLNITFNSFDSESGKNGTVGGEAKMYVDWMKIAFNHTLTSMKANGLAATKSGNAFEVTLDNSEYIEKPILSFTGEVRDQAQDVVWKDTTFDADFEIRTADIRNWAENGVDYTDYTLTVKRPLDEVNVLSALLAAGDTMNTFNPATTSYTITIPSSQRNLPDLQPIPGSSLQHVTTDYNETDSTMTITVTPEKGEAKVYTVRFVTDLSDDTTLADIVADGLSYDAETRTYDLEAEQLPLISFEKKSDLQRVSLVNGVITVTAENGATGTYTITCHQPALTTTGVLSTFLQGTDVMTDLGGTTLEKTAAKPQQYISFERQFPTDSVVFTQRPEGMEWGVYGTAQNTYTWTYPTSLSSNTALASITRDGEDYEDFLPSEKEYELLSDSTLLLAFVPAETAQRLTTTQTAETDGLLYTTLVTAEDGTSATYRVRIRRPLSPSATLNAILLDGVPVEGFDPETKSYTVTLPVAPGAKSAQPKMPDITYEAGHKGQKVTVETGRLNGEGTVFTVESEDGKATEIYTLVVKAEKSHCSDLTGIIVNGESLDHFEAGRHYYSVSLPSDEIEIVYTSDDRFQTVTTTATPIPGSHGYNYTVHVAAEDGTFSEYYVEIYIEALSNDAQLANIFLDNKDFLSYGAESGLNPSMRPFDPGNNEYHINILRDSVPAVSAQLKTSGQSIEMETYKDSIFLHVKAEDGTVNTYRLYFEYELSKDTRLVWLTVNSDTIVAPDSTFYVYDKLLVGDELPVVDAEAVNGQADVRIDATRNPITVTVTAEDKSYQKTYTVLCDFQPSRVNTLEMIYANGKPWAGFEPTTFAYDTTLAAGETFPLIDYGELSAGDHSQWPYIDSVTVSLDSREHIWVHQTTVTAQSSETNVYTLTFRIRKWDVDTLESIEVENIPLPGFKGTETEYYYTLTPNQVAELNGRAPAVKYFLGEAHQRVQTDTLPDSYTGKSLGFKHVITVKAEDNTTRTYTIHYPIEPSSDATLRMIMIDGKPLKDFDPERSNYRVDLDFGLPVPNVTAVTHDDQITAQYQVGDTVTIEVWAEDKTYNAYTIVFERVQSTITTLENIILMDKDEKQFPYDRFYFDRETYDYTVSMPYDPEVKEFTVPAMRILKSDPFQTVTVDTVYATDEDRIEVLIHVLAPNNEDEAEYKLVFLFSRNSDATLTDIQLRGVSLRGFKSDKMDYPYAHPYGSDSTAFFTAADVTIVKSDPLAADTIYREENGTIVITVTAQDRKTQNTYSIQQLFGKDTVNTLRMIYLDGEEMPGFHPDTTFYTYYLMNGAGATPLVTGVPTSENADTTYTRNTVNDTTYIYCTAQDGSDRVYRILFLETDVNDGIAASSSKEVFVRRVPGTNQLFVATIRSGVFFYLYDRNGHLVYAYENLATADPNSFEVSRDSWENEVLLDVDMTDPNSGVYVDLIPGQVYFYSFVSMKKQIARGKLIAVPIQ